MSNNMQKWLLILISTLALCTFIYIVFGYPDILKINPETRFHPPFKGHIFGTDELGRDVFKRTVAGFGYSFSLVVLALTGSSVIGLCLGIITGFFENRFISRITEQLVNIVWSLPGLVFFIAVTTYFGRDFFIIVIAMACVSWVPIARVIRFEFEREKRRDYVRMMRAFGYNNGQIIGGIIANTKIPFIVVVLSVAIDLVAAESGLSFLGLGINPPKPSLGMMIYNGLYYASEGWWMVTSPLLVLVLLVMTLKWCISQFKSYGMPK